MLARALPYVPRRRAPRGRRPGGRRAPARGRAAHGADDRLLVGPDNGLLLAGRRALRRGRRGGRDLDVAVAAGARVGHVPRPRPVRPGRRAARRRARRWPTPARRSTPTSSSGSSCPQPRRRRASWSRTRWSIDASATSARRAADDDLAAACGSGTRSRSRRRPPARGYLRGRSPTPSRGELLLYEDAAGALALAVNGGDAAAVLGARAGRRGRACARRDALGRPRLHLREIDSTNDRARELAAAGAPHGTLVTAGAQTAGRGRQGRRWTAPAGRARCCCRWCCASPMRCCRCAPGSRWPTWPAPRRASSGRTTCWSTAARSPACWSRRARRRAGRCSGSA